MDLKEQFLAQFQSEYTLASYTRDLQVFFDYLSSKNITISDLTMDKLREYCKTDSNRRRLACIKSFIKYAYNQGYISTNCGRCIIVPKLNPKKKQITMDIGDRLLHEAKKINDSFYLFVLLLKHLGLRLNELRLLKCEHITMEDQILCFNILGKGNKTRTVYLSPTLSRKVIRKPLEKKYTRYIQSKKHIAVKIRSIVGNYITGIGNTIQVFVLSEYIDKLKQAGLPYLPLQKVLDDNVEEPLDLLECLAQKFTDVDISKQEIKLFMDAGTSFKPRDVPIDIDGANIARNVVVRLLKSLIIYMGIYNIEDKHGVIEHLHRVKKHVRVHKRVEKGSKQKTKNLKVKNSAVPQKDISLRDFNTTVEQLKIQLGSKNSMHSFNIDQIYSMRKDKKLFHYLSLFMDLKAAIDPSIATPVDVVNYILSNPKGMYLSSSTRFELNTFTLS